MCSQLSQTYGFPALKSSVSHDLHILLSPLHLYLTSPFLQPPSKHKYDGATHILKMHFSPYFHFENESWQVWRSWDYEYYFKSHLFKSPRSSSNGGQRETKISQSSTSISSAQSFTRPSPILHKQQLQDVQCDQFTLRHILIYFLILFLSILKNI